MSARPLIPRQKLFDNPTFFGAKLSAVISKARATRSVRAPIS
jgi:hypothetical protein